MTALRAGWGLCWVWGVLLVFSAGCENLPPPPSSEPEKPKPAVVIGPPAAPPVQQAEPVPKAPVEPPKPDAKVVIEAFQRKSPFDVTDDDLEALAQLDEEGRKEIKTLNLMGSKISLKGVNTFAKFDNLESLSLSSTPLKNDALQRLKEMHEEGHLSLLTTLELNRMGIDDAGLELLTKLGQIKHLNLGSTSISDAGLELCRFMPELESLDVSETSINGFGFKWLKGHLGFKKLIAHHCQLQDRWLVNLKGLPIEYLHIGQSGVSDVGLAQHIKTIKELKYLNLGFNRLSDQGISALKTLVNLETLICQGCENISDQGLYQIRNLKKLRSVVMTGNRCTVNGQQGLKKLIPEVEVSL